MLKKIHRFLALVGVSSIDRPSEAVIKVAVLGIVVWLIAFNASLYVSLP